MVKIPRSAIKTKDQKVLLAFTHLPVIMNVKSGRDNNSNAGKLKASQTLVHIVKTDKTWQQVAVQHKNLNWPWILYNRLGEQVSILGMLKDKFICKSKTAAEAVLLTMGIFYCAIMPYPAILNGAFLFIQDEILMDGVHMKDRATLQKCCKEYRKYLDNAKNTKFEELF